jgi:S1-C subfamily serine protease
VRPFAERALPAIVRLEFEDGRQAAGTIIEERGQILTAGHAVIGPHRDCRVIFNDGKSAAARTLGVAREFDLGLVKIQPEGRYPRLEAHGPNELPQNQPYLAFANGQPQVTQIRRAYRSTVWTDLAPREWLAGGPLLDRDGRLIAVQVARSRFGGLHCTRLQEAWNQLGRLRNGEVFGAWPAGSEPSPGCDGAIDDKKYRLTSVERSGPAAAIGLALGDEIIKLDGRPIGGPDDWQRVLAEHDAGQEVAIDYLRSGQSRQAKLKLVPRVP